MALGLGPIICDIAGLTLTPQDEEIIRHPLVGGLILFARNYESPAQLITLIKAIRNIRPNILISVDQEGGRVQRLKAGFSELPPLGTLGKLLDMGKVKPAQIMEYAEQLGQLMAIEVQHFGIDISFAPVVDSDKGISQIIGDRAFHADPLIITELAAAYITGMGKAGMGATLKHFPGHGGVVADSHLELPIDTRSEFDLQQDMVPFKNLIQKKIKNIHAVMPAHIIFDKIDGLPVGFSHIWLQKILRQEIGFKGAIISDDLSMEAASYLGNMLTRVNMALDAGCDNVLICNNRAAVEQVLADLKDNRSEDSKSKINRLINAKIDDQDLTQNAVWKNCVEVLNNLTV